MSVFSRTKRGARWAVGATLVLCTFLVTPLRSQTPTDPGPAVPTTPPTSLSATGPSCGAGLPAILPGITDPNEINYFCAALKRFQEVASVSGVVTPGVNGQCQPADGGHNATGSTISCAENSLGLGPRMNANSCAMCHSFPLLLGASPLKN